MEAYCELAQRITMDLRNDDDGNEKDERQTTSTGKADGAAEAQNAEVHQHAVETQEILEQIRECKIDNIMHAAKIQRLGEQHVLRAKSVASKARAEVMQVKRGINSSKNDGIKHLSKAIGNEPAKPLTCVKIDRDTPGGGRKGEITADPQEVDAIVKRAWKVIYDGMAG